ncbi:MAG TPA: KH domain-containing protein [Candidatus Dormibacteraeota bacterium]|nr:KH domain-containing protein [Candidatus Dormibacteraeota bacterium]
MSSIDQQFVEFVIKSLVSNPDAVKIERRIDEKGVLLELTVDPEDLGRVIGKRGATAQSLRTLLRALGTKNDARYNLKIIDNGEPGAGRSRSDDQQLPNDDQPQPQVADHDDTSDNQLPEADKEPEAPEETDTTDRLSQTRKELEELDDLDV